MRIGENSRNRKNRENRKSTENPKNRKRLWRWAAGVSGFVLVAAAFWTGRLSDVWAGSGSSVPGSLSVSLPVISKVNPSTRLYKESVLTIGGSMAYGWKDPKNDSYIERAFAGLTASTNTKYSYVNHAIVGAGAANFAKNHLTDYSNWLNQSKPDVVVISWGLLNDIAQKIPANTFDSDMRLEISAALQKHAVVIVVTPPVSKASYTYAKDKTEGYIAQEIQIVQDYHNPNVRVFDLYHQMMDYLLAHHETYEPYMGDNWHPNTAGHVLAGQILQNDIVTVLGQGPVRYAKQTEKAAKS